MDVSHVKSCIQMSKAEPLPLFPSSCPLQYAPDGGVIPWTNSMNIPQARIKRDPDSALGCRVNRRIHHITIVYVWTGEVFS
jgi:hypothetical protein